MNKFEEGFYKRAVAFPMPKMKLPSAGRVKAMGRMAKQKAGNFIAQNKKPLMTGAAGGAAAGVTSRMMGGSKEQR